MASTVSKLCKWFQLQFWQRGCGMVRVVRASVFPSLGNGVAWQRWGQRCVVSSEARPSGARQCIQQVFCGEKTAAVFAGMRCRDDWSALLKNFIFSVWLCKVCDGVCVLVVPLVFSQRCFLEYLLSLLAAFPCRETEKLIPAHWEEF